MGSFFVPGCEATHDETPSRHATRMIDEAKDTHGGIHRPWLTVGEVARTIGLTEERVRQLIRKRQIKATKIGGWLVQPEDLDAFIRSRTNIPGA